MKKVIISIMVILIVAISIIIGYIKFGYEKNNNTNNIQSELEITENQNLDIEEDENENLEKEEIENLEEESIQENKTENGNTNLSSNSNTGDKQESQSTVTQVQQSKETSSTVSSQIKEEISEPESVLEPVKVNPEYENLKQQATFSTYEECNRVSNEVSLEYALQFDENYQNTSCSSVAYNGELLGYKLTIYFRDGTSKDYK